MAVPEIALRFREAVKDTVGLLREHPLIGRRYPLRNPRLQNLRSWPVMGIEAIHICYLSEMTAIRVIRILHQKRNVRRILEKDRDV
jgi:plasmid stabilization system protein ParE